MEDGNQSKAERKVGVQNQNSSNLSIKGLIMICTGSVLLAGCIIVFIFYLYSLNRSSSNNRRRNDGTESSSSSADAISRGLEPSILATLSVIRFGSLKYGGIGAVPPNKECAVCLSELEDDEMGRVLPNCKHSFHLQCIDLWFKFNSNCPLCRTQVQLEMPIENKLDDDDAVVVVGLESGLSSVVNHQTTSLRVSQIEVVV